MLMQRFGRVARYLERTGPLMRDLANGYPTLEARDVVTDTSGKQTFK